MITQFTEPQLSIPSNLPEGADLLHLADQPNLIMSLELTRPSSRIMLPYP